MQLVRKILKIIGPGFIAGASDDDPTAVATYSQSGGMFGYKQLWTALFTAPFMIIVQEMCGRIGIVSGKELGTILHMHYSKSLLYSILVLLVLVNLITLGADLGGMAATAQLLWNIPFIMWLIVLTLIILGLQIFLSYKTYANVLKYTALAFLGYIISAFLVKQDWKEALLYTFLPYVSLHKDYLLNLVAILGTNISPYLFFWQADQEVEEEVEEKKLPDIDVGKPKIEKGDLTSMRTDTVIGMIFSNIIVYFIEIATAATLGAHGITNVSTPAQAAQALKPFAGQYAFWLFAIGIMGSGFLAIPALSTSASYAVSRTFKWKVGLTKTFFEAPFFYMLIILLTILGIGINFLPVKPFDLLVYAAALNGILTPFLLVVILLVANDKRIMGKYTNSSISNMLGWIITVLTGIAASALIYSLLPLQ